MSQKRSVGGRKKANDAYANSPVEVNDDTIMWYGVHIGKPMQKVPASYLLFLVDDAKIPAPQVLIDYVNDNRDVLSQELGSKYDDYDTTLD